jgi:hypothetical protein
MKEHFFKTEAEAIEYAKENDFELVILSSEPEHAEAPYVVLNYEDITDIRQFND